MSESEVYERLLPDNGVITHPRAVKILLNDAYRELATHYSAAVLPAVSYPHVGELVDVRVTARIIEICSRSCAGEYCTRDGVLPDGPRYQEWDTPRDREWAARIGVHTTTVVCISSRQSLLRSKA